MVAILQAKRGKVLVQVQAGKLVWHMDNNNNFIRAIHNTDTVGTRTVVEQNMNINMNICSDETRRIKFIPSILYPVLSHQFLLLLAL